MYIMNINVKFQIKKSNINNHKLRILYRLKILINIIKFSHIYITVIYHLNYRFLDLKNQIIYI